jgi:hypothetical protein
MSWEPDSPEQIAERAELTEMIQEEQFKTRAWQGESWRSVQRGDGLHA